MGTTTLQSVLTLEDAAAFLRLSEDTVRRRAEQGEIPGREVEGAWRFLLAALEDWLRTPDPRTVLLGQAGALSDDESLDDLLGEIYRARGRPEAEDGQL